MIERHSTTAQYLNGLAVAALATAGAAFLAGHVSPVAVLVSALLSGCLHVLALWVARRH